MVKNSLTRSFWNSKISSLVATISIEIEKKSARGEQEQITNNECFFKQIFL